MTVKLLRKQEKQLREVRDKIIALLGNNETIDVAPEKLYVNKNGSWSGRFLMSGYDLGFPKLEYLLKEFEYARTNEDIKISYVRKHRGRIFKDFMKACEKTLARLKRYKRAKFVVSFKTEKKTKIGNSEGIYRSV